jgi:hypothetical protein
MSSLFHRLNEVNGEVEGIRVTRQVLRCKRHRRRVPFSSLISIEHVMVENSDSSMPM